MKKFIALFLTGMLMFALAACGNQAGNSTSSTPEPSNSGNQQESASSQESQSQSSVDGETDKGESKILVAYFSSAGNVATDEPVKGNLAKGNTKLVAELIQEQVGGDLFFIETVDKYPSNYNDAIGVAMQELRNNTKPALASHVENMDDYDVVFIGYPIWWQTIPQALLTFIEEYSFAGKTVIPFCTYEDSGIGRSIGDLEKALPDSTLLKEFSVSEHDLKDAEESVKKWLSELNLADLGIKVAE